ncbi:hypothetical protein [Mycobacterium intracellulare]|uniref:hypothetical protein n=1 Tax=Mycobacterium intracellulare TaxID=1767 RepID=UPI0011AB59E0|nr:hypothetical protein [Mycobacterium intracellulare]
MPDTLTPAALDNTTPRRRRAENGATTSRKPLKSLSAGVFVRYSKTSPATVLGLWVANRGPVGAAVVYALYVVSDLAVVVIFSWRAHRQRDWASAVALTGVVVLLVSDVLFVYFAWWRPQASIPYGADVGYIIFPLAMSVAASYTLEARGRQQR